MPTFDYFTFARRNDVVREIEGNLSQGFLNEETQQPVLCFWCRKSHHVHELVKVQTSWVVPVHDDEGTCCEGSLGQPVSPLDVRPSGSEIRKRLIKEHGPEMFEDAAVRSRKSKVMKAVWRKKKLKRLAEEKIWVKAG